ncbi:LysR family transcriptional regulator [Lysobacteraceae bacterium NML93-0792]|nr:LysR family transcriptional regulator [Xanthomonadaceae bacterium NML93-0792]PBS16573.1 LysR family transcriptional regulator [Xanthomonadaceae bacterium NML93-0793]PBS19948.1 LysR family transcriptional regulator [Xanthomonadaceae bacterium NML93-0831]
MLETQQLSSFLAVVRAGSFVAAADATGLSKAAISRHVAELEARLGVRLLHRTTRRMSLSEDGQRFHARALELMAALSELEADTASSGGAATGLLRINAPLTFGNLHLAPLWPRFIAAHPDVSLDVTLNDRVVDLVDEGYDVAIRIARTLDPQLVGRRLADTRIVLCASPGYLATRGTPTHPRELAAHQILAYSYWATGDDWSFNGPEGETRVRVTPRIHTNSGDTCRAAALDDKGIVLQPDFLVGPDVKRGALVELMPDYRSSVLGIFAVYATRKHLPMKTRRLIDFLVDALRAPVWR